jgi:hypothetical protein
MYNEDFLQDVLWTHGVKQAIIYCELESDRYDRMFKEMTYINDPLHRQELQYERDWWGQRAEKLKNDEGC